LTVLVLGEGSCGGKVFSPQTNNKSLLSKKVTIYENKLIYNLIGINNQMDPIEKFHALLLISGRDV
jgi:hypothetical protein